MMKKIQLLIGAIIIAMNVSSQCFEDQHTTNWFDAWVACSPSSNPNPARGVSYWLQYDLGATYTLGQTHFWNINDPAHKNYGLKNIVIDYSLDGVNWSEWGTHLLLQGSGLPTYEGLPGPDLGELEARYVIITAVDNWGGACYGLSELKIEVSTPTVTTPPNSDCLKVTIYPNPAVSQSAMEIKTICEGNVSYIIRNSLGEEIVTDHLGEVTGKIKVSLPIEDMPSGIYSITIYQAGTQLTRKMVVI